MLYYYYYYYLDSLLYYIYKKCGNIYLLSELILNMSNVDQFKSRAQLEVFLSKNPKGFLESLEQNQSFRGNFHSLLEQWNTSDIIQLATLLQSKEYRDPITNKLRIAETEVMATHFTQWANKELNAIELNPHHQMGYLQEYIKEKEAQQQEIEHRKQQAKKAQEREALEEKDSNDKKQQIGIQLQILAAQASLHQAFQQLFKGMANNGASFQNSEISQTLRNSDPALYQAIQKQLDPEGKMDFKTLSKQTNYTMIALKGLQDIAQNNPNKFKIICDNIKPEELKLLGIDKNDPNWREQVREILQDPHKAVILATSIMKNVKPEHLEWLVEDTVWGKVIHQASKGNTKEAAKATVEAVASNVKTLDERSEYIKNDKSASDSWANTAMVNPSAIEDSTSTNKEQHSVQEQQVNNKKDTMGIG